MVDDDDESWVLDDKPGESNDLWNSGRLDTESPTINEAPTEWLGEVTPEDSARMEHRPPDVYAETEQFEIVRTLSSRVEYKRGDKIINQLLLAGLLILTLSCFLQVFRAKSLVKEEARPTPTASQEPEELLTINPDNPTEPAAPPDPGSLPLARVQSAMASGRPGEFVRIEVVLSNPATTISKPVRLSIEIDPERGSKQIVVAKSLGVTAGATTPVVIETPFKAGKPLSRARKKFKTIDGIVVKFRATIEEPE